MITFTCFKGLPLDYESFLLEKYYSYIVSCRYVEVYYPSYDINYMLVTENESLIDLILYGNKGVTTRCFNALVEMDQIVIEEFVRKIFEIYSSIKKVIIDASYKNYNIKKSILNFKSDDHILQLPLTMEEYYKKLSSSTRQTIKNRRVRLLRDYSDVKFVTKYGNEIDQTVIDKIFQLDFNKLKHKGVIHGFDIANKNNHYKNNIFQFVHHYGCVAYIEIDGEIVAGSINTIINKSLFGHVTAYDKNYYKYNVGEICAFYLIQTCIENGLSIFHFLWGQSDLKKRMLAKPNVLSSYIVYRSYSFDYLFNTIKVLFAKVLIRAKQSKFVKPFKTSIKYINSGDWKKILSVRSVNSISEKKYYGMQDEIKT